MVFAVSGDLDPERAAEGGAELRGRGAARPAVPAQHRARAAGHLVRARWWPRFPKLGEARLQLAFPSVRLDSPDLFAMDLLATVLGGGESSQLVEEIRDSQAARQRDRRQRRDAELRGRHVRGQHDPGPGEGRTRDRGGAGRAGEGQDRRRGRAAARAGQGADEGRADQADADRRGRGRVARDRLHHDRRPAFFRPLRRADPGGHQRRDQGGRQEVLRPHPAADDVAAPGGVRRREGAAQGGGGAPPGRADDAAGQGAARVAGRRGSSWTTAPSC